MKRILFSNGSHDNSQRAGQVGRDIANFCSEEPSATGLV